MYAIKYGRVRLINLAGMSETNIDYHIETDSMNHYIGSFLGVF